MNIYGIWSGPYGHMVIPICIIVWHKGIKEGFRQIWAYAQFPYVCMHGMVSKYPAGVLKLNE